MGIDIYMRWPDMTEADHKAQITGFAIDKGKVGYLREAYHGEPYATKVLVPEAWSECGVDADDNALGTPIAAAVMRERLPAAIEAAIERGRKLYKERLTRRSPAVRSYIEFVELAERLEAEKGEPVRVYASY